MLLATDFSASKRLLVLTRYKQHETFHVGYADIYRILFLQLEFWKKIYDIR